MLDEIHLIIIWSKAQNQKQKIINDITNKFDILNIYYISWSKDKFSENLSRFYGENLPKNSNKEKHCGNDSFTCIIVKDVNPQYEIRETSKGNKVVNINLFDAKQLYRQWTGGGHKIHATDNIGETKLQLVLLLNRTYSSFLNKKLDVDVEEKLHPYDLIGANGWTSLKEVFSVLNETLNYVVLRNFENIEQELNALHPDIDLLTDNKQLAVNILNAKPTTRKSYRVQYNVLIDNRNINFDLRYVGDAYYSSKWERNIINTRIKYFYLYVPNDKNYFYSLLYHVLLHKKNISQDYMDKLIKLANNIDLKISEKDFIETIPLNILTLELDKCNYSFKEPIDISVYWNQKYLSKSINHSISFKRSIHYKYMSLKTFIKKIIKKLIK